MAPSSNTPRLLVALDFDNYDACMALVRQLDPSLCRLKVGKELFTYCGPALVKEVQQLGFDVFLDLKFHDIPNTVAKAVAAAAELGVWMVNVHASGGSEMLLAAKEALSSYSKPPLLIAVTVLTSMDEESLKNIGISVSPLEHVKSLAKLTFDAGLDGVVCSAKEVSMLKENFGHEFLTITPGIRPLEDAAGDQKRIVTPEKARALGSDYLVVGRPITQAVDPLSKCKSIAEVI